MGIFFFYRQCAQALSYEINFISCQSMHKAGHGCCTWRKSNRAGRLWSGPLPYIIYNQGGLRGREMIFFAPYLPCSPCHDFGLLAKRVGSHERRNVAGRGFESNLTYTCTEAWLSASHKPERSPSWHAFTLAPQTTPCCCGLARIAFSAEELR